MYVGAAVITFTAGRMIAHDHWLRGWFDAHPATLYVMDAVLLLAVCGGGWLARRRQRLQARPSPPAA
jgi:hypothetical protein